VITKNDTANILEEVLMTRFHLDDDTDELDDEDDDELDDEKQLQRHRSKDERRPTKDGRR